ncbi:hypothetical protein PCASD_03429 [Puccinia coronata f. sp. avenae]|uniref:DDE Tnp4 domain-containing protein n=1 Tax=Puccinia coronata f. sp. avenae TaxID=200324 RepID=A0A2N5VF83_9BASI|nr:hypothetical protein PCASD_03429 [Puccinia coronata f. sp. avenae]
MRQYSERQNLIRDVSLILSHLENNDTDDMASRAVRIRPFPTLGQLAFPRSQILQTTYNTLFSKTAEYTDILQHVLSQRYLHPRRSPKSRGEFDIEKLFNMSDSEFRQAARTSKEGFMHVLDKIVGHEVFHRGGRRPQLPIPHQLALTLERLGSNGNGASIGRFSRNLTVGRGTVVKVLRWVVEALISLGQTYVQWPNKDRCTEISDVMRKEGFPGCVGFVDGTTIPMFQRPGFDGEVFFDRKKRYSLNAQIVCDCDKYITMFSTGWPGSTGNSKSYKRMQLHLDPTQFFDEGQYLLADSAYKSSHTVIPGYKYPASNIQINADFNYCLAKARV